MSRHGKKQRQHPDEQRERYQPHEKPTRTTLVQARGPNQIAYFEALRDHDVTFAIGPAGTGKTLIATAFGIQSVLQGFYTKLIISRPIVEAGEELGFLPGTLQEKCDPYLRPVFDFVEKQTGRAKLKKMLEDGTVEISPLAYMRGRTFENAFIILDEAQNTTPDQMLMFLTRLGQGSKMVVTGDPTQTDTRGQSGLVWAETRLQEVEGVASCHFDESDIVRHPLVGPILAALHR